MELLFQVHLGLKMKQERKALKNASLHKSHDIKKKVIIFVVTN